MVKKYYIDTSVFGGYFDSEFDISTRDLFKQINDKGIVILYSEMTESELEDAPEKVKKIIRELPRKIVEYLELTEETMYLADKYIQENVVGKTSRDDCIHIALATINRADVLISWNFKHESTLKSLSINSAII